MRLDFPECEKQGLLRKIPPSKENAAKSVGKAAALLEEAERDFANKSFTSCLLLAYTAMFHAARALLLKDGWREKSHACIARYLEAKYVGTGLLEQKWVDVLDRFRNLRHADLYDLEFKAGSKEATEAISTARLFLQRLRKLV